GHVLGVARGQRDEVREPEDGGAERRHDAADHRVVRDGRPRVGVAAGEADDVEDEGKDETADRDRHDHRMDRVPGDAGWCTHGVLLFGWRTLRGPGWNVGLALHVTHALLRIGRG